MTVKIQYELKDYNGMIFKIIKSIPFHIASEILVKFADYSEQKKSIPTSTIDELVKKTIICTVEFVDDNKFEEKDMMANWLPGELYIDTFSKIMEFAKGTGNAVKANSPEKEMPDDTEDIFEEEKENKK